MMCHACGLTNRPGSNYCRRCGTSLPPTPRSAYPDDPSWWSLQSRAARLAFLLGLVLALGLLGAIAGMAFAGPLRSSLPPAAASESRRQTSETDATTGATASGVTTTTADATKPGLTTASAAADAAGQDSGQQPSSSAFATAPSALQGQAAIEGSGPSHLRAYLEAKRAELGIEPEAETWWESTVWYRRYPQYRKPLAEVLADLGQ
jgi:hypothetical protein